MRMRAACAWSRTGVIHGRTAAQLYLRQPVTLPICLRAVHGGDHLPRWLRVSEGQVPQPLVDNGIRVTSPVHCAVELAAEDGGEVLVEMLRKRLFAPAQLLEAASYFSGSPGNQRRARVVNAALDNPWSIGELKLQDLLRAAGIKGWVANRPLRIRGRLVFPDVRFPAQRLVLEFDGEAVHGDHAPFEDDRRRQNLLVLEGYRVLRFTWEMVVRHPEEVIAIVREALSRRA